MEPASSTKLLAIEIGGTKLQIVAGDGTGRIYHRHRFVVDPTRGGVGIREQMEKALGSLMTGLSPVAIGVGFGGPVDWRTGTTCCSHQVEGWAGFALGEWLRNLTGLPIVVENDSNTAALGEAHCGAGRGSNPVFYFNMGSGMGGGLIVDGKIYHGEKPGEVEFGHLKLDRQGTTVESRCSGWAVDRRIRALATLKPEGRLARLVGEITGGEATHLVAALAAGDDTAQEVIDETAADLGFALSHVVHLFHPKIVVVGGGLSLLGEPLRAAVEKAMRAHVMEAFQPGPVVRQAELKEDSVPVGALLLAEAAAVGG